MTLLFSPEQLHSFFTTEMKLLHYFPAITEAALKQLL